MSDLTETLVIATDTSQVEAGLGKARRSIDSLAQAAVSAGAQAAQGVGSIGAAADATATQTSRASAAMQRELQGLIAKVEGAGKSLSEQFRIKADLRGFDVAGLEPLLARLDAAQAKQRQLGQATQFTAQQLRQVGPQVTDIVTQIAGGQNAFQVMIQQGGQLKDVFGGVGNAARALGQYLAGLFTPVTVTIGAVVATLAAVGVAFSQGRAEAAEYAKAIILSGNAAGVTVGKLQALAASVAGATGATQGQAADVLATVVANGAIAGDQLERVAATAIRLEKQAGIAVGDTVKAFAELGKEPVAASLKLNESTRFLTVRVYEQIRALEEQGKTIDAARIAQQAYADAMNGRAAQLEGNLGLVERAWRGIVGTAKAAWDAMLGIGRQASPADRLAGIQQQIADKENQIARAQDGFANTGGGAAIGTGASARRVATLRSEIQALQAQAAALGGVAAAAQASADAQAEEARQVQARSEFAKIANQFASEQLRMEREIAQAREAGKRAGIEQAEVERTVGDIRAKYAKKGPTERPEVDREALDRARSLKDVLADLARIEQDATAQNEGLSKSMARLAVEMASPVFAKRTAQQQEEIVNTALVADAAERVNAARKAGIKETEEAARAHEALYEATLKATDGAREDLRRQLDANAAIGLSTLALADLEAARLSDRAATLEWRAAQIELIDPVSDLAKSLREQAQALRDLADAKKAGAFKSEIVASAKEAEGAWRRAAEQIEGSITDALMRGFESGKGFAQVLRDTVVNMFKTLVLRPVVSAIVAPFAGSLASPASAAVQGASALGGIGNAASTLGALTGTFGQGIAAGFSQLTAGVGPSAFFSAATELAGASMSTALGTAVGYLGPIAAGIAILVSLAKSGETRQGAGYQVNNGVAVLGGGPSGGAINQALEQKLVQSTYDAINTTLRSLGSSVTVTAFQAGLESSGKGRGATFAGGALSTGAAFGQTYDPALYTQSLTPEQAATQFGDKLARAQLEALRAAADTLPGYVQRALDKLDIQGLDAAGAQQAVAEIVALPTTLLAQAGLARDQLIQTFAQGLQTGNAAAAGQAVADQVVTSIRSAMLGTASAQIFDIINQGVIAPVISAIVNGQSIADALNQASIDAAVDKAVATANALAAVLADPRVTQALDDFRARLAAGLGQAGAGLNVPASFTVASPASQAVASAADTAADAAAQRLADSLKALAKEGAQLQAQLLGLQGDTAGAKAALRALAIDGFSALEVAAYDANEAIRAQIAEYERLAAQRQALTSLASTAYSAADRFLDPAQARAFRLEVLGQRAAQAGAGAPVADLVKAFDGISDAGIKAFVQQFLLLPGATVEAKQAVLELGTSLLDLSAASETAALDVLNRSVAAERKLIEARASAARETIAQAQAVTSAARNAQRDLLGQGATGAFATAQARAFLDTSLATLRASGYLPDADQLSAAIGQSVRGLGDTFFASQADAEFARVVLAGTLGEIGDAGAQQLDNAKAQLKAAESAAQSLDALLDQFSGLTGAIVALPEAIGAVIAAQMQRGTLGDIAKLPAIANFIQPIAVPDGPGGPSTPGPLFPGLPSVAPIDVPILPPISTPGPTFPSAFEDVRNEVAGLRAVMVQMVALQAENNTHAARTVANTDPNNVQLVEDVNA